MITNFSKLTKKKKCIQIVDVRTDSLHEYKETATTKSPYYITLYI